ncbi:MAG: hypothetical protein ACJ8MH_05520 [Povalibacter sp.]
MFFLSAYLLLAIGALVLAARAFAHLFGTRDRSLQLGVAAQHPFLVLTCAASALFAFAILDERWIVRINAMHVLNWAPVSVALFSGLFLALSVARIRTLARSLQFSRATFNAPLGAWLVSLCLSIYLMFTVIDHWWFFKDSRHSTMGYPHELGVSNVSCADLAIIQFGATSAKYRCATSVVIDAGSGHPFMPWPYYSAGESRELQARIDEILNQPEVDDRSEMSLRRP